MIENPFKSALYPGLVMIATAIVLIFINPLNEGNLPRGFFTPIIAFEFMNNPVDVYNFFQVENVSEYEGRMMLGNKVDYLFMIVYSLFLSLIGIGFYRVHKLKFILVTAIVLPLLICTADALENRNIALIVDRYQGFSFQNQLQYLSIFTWVKWTGIVSLLLIYASLILKNGRLNISIAVTNALAFVFCVIAFVTNGIVLEIMAMLVVLSLFLYFVGAWNGFGYLVNKPNS